MIIIDGERCRRKILSLARRRADVNDVMADMAVSEEQACQILGPHHRDAVSRRLDPSCQTGHSWNIERL